MAKYTYKSIHKALKKYDVDNILSKDANTRKPVDVSTPCNDAVYPGFFTFEPTDDGYHIEVRLMNSDDNDGYYEAMLKRFHHVKEAAEFVNKFYSLMGIIPEIDYDNNNTSIDYTDNTEYLTELNDEAIKAFEA